MYRILAVRPQQRSTPYTAFKTPKGFFQFKTMPFGLVNVGVSFCRLIRIVLQGLRNVDSFVDDTWIFAETWKKTFKIHTSYFS